MMAPAPTPNRFEIKHLAKTYPKAVGLEDVSLDVSSGEIHAILGENGAGKTTVMKILGGLEPAGSYEGELRKNGELLLFRNPADSIHHGIAVVPRRLSVFDKLSVAENIVVGNWEQKSAFFVRESQTIKQAQAALDFLQVKLDLNIPASTLNPGHKRVLMIARAVNTHAQLLVLDEPASFLNSAEAMSQLLRIIRQLAKNYVAILYLTRRPGEVLQIADRVTVLRDGAVAEEFTRADFDETKLALAMISQRPGYDNYIDEDEEPERGLTGMFRSLFGRK